jgi:hypothetical protein
MNIVDMLWSRRCKVISAVLSNDVLHAVSDGNLRGESSNVRSIQAVAAHICSILT